MQIYRVLFLLLFLLSLSHSKENNFFIDSTSAIKMIDSKKVEFISVDRDPYVIVGSKYIDFLTLQSGNVFGELECTPFYICPKVIVKDLKRQKVKEDSLLILYDNQYGVYASAVYLLLESMGYKNLKILDGGYLGIKKLDPNQKSYNRYLKEKIDCFFEMNSTNSAEVKKDIKSLENKLNLLEPLLLVHKRVNSIKGDRNTTTLKESNSSTDRYFVDKSELRELIDKIRTRGKTISNQKIVDSCGIVDIVGNSNGGYEAGVYSLDWREVIEPKDRKLKSEEFLNNYFIKSGLEKEDELYLYCMSEPVKALFLSMVLRRVGYSKTKVFSGNWSLWRGKLN